MRNGPTKTAVITSTIDIDIGKNDLARRHRAAAEDARSQRGLEIANVPRQACAGAHHVSL